MTQEFCDFDIFLHHFPTMNNQENRPILTIKETSDLIGISVSTINRLIKQGKFPQKRKLSTKRIGFLRYEIDQWIEGKERI